MLDARRSIFALLSLRLMEVLMVSGVSSDLLAALIACVRISAFKCITIHSPTRPSPWSSPLLIVGMLPFALAPEKTGGIDLAA